VDKENTGEKLNVVRGRGYNAADFPLTKDRGRNLWEGRHNPRTSWVGKWPWVGRKKPRVFQGGVGRVSPRGPGVPGGLRKSDCGLGRKGAGDHFEADD